MDIVVIRGLGDSYEEVIQNSLASDIQTKRELGRNYLDDHALPVKDIQVKVLYRDSLRNGEVIIVESAITGEQWIAKVTGVHHEIKRSSEGGGVDTTLTLSLPVESI